MTQEAERLQKFLARMGVASRRKAETLILEGKVEVNGQVVNTLGSKIIPGQDVISIDGKVLENEPAKRYIMLNKPAGWICSLDDEKGRRTVIDLLNGVEERVYPVGRLDYSTSGLLLLTNDGELMNCLLHPSHEIDKTYLAKIPTKITNYELKKLQRGIKLEDGMTAPAKAKVLKSDDTGDLVELTIHEGRNRQVRRMLQALGHEVAFLQRSGFAFLTLDKLPLSKWRNLNLKEVYLLRKLCGLEK